MHNKLDLKENSHNTSNSVVPTGFSSWHTMPKSMSYIHGYNYKCGNKNTRNELDNQAKIFVSNDDLID